MDYREVIESKYSRLSWEKLLHDIFKSKAEFFANPAVVSANKDIAREVYYIGKITLSDNNLIAVYEVKLSEKVEIDRMKRGIRDLLLPEWRNGGFAGAFMLCYKESESVLRFSYVSEDWSFDDKGKMQKNSTDPKRYTYLLGEGHRSRTAIDRFKNLSNSKLSLKDVTDAFSVEALSKSFFNDYRETYADIVEYITGYRYEKQGNKWVNTWKHDPNKEIYSQFERFEDPGKSIRDYIKNLMGRLVFLQFLQKKGWMGVPANKSWGEGDKEFMQHLYANSPYQDDFIESVLEPLFDDINNKREGDLVSSPNVGQNIKVPYLNGGLFERNAEDETTVVLPKEYFDKIFNFFSWYNFTIDENDPNDQEVGVDPEMLGRIFENLLEDNKDKGAFYTPKEIVEYMCRESLIAYLQTGSKEETERQHIRDFVVTHKKDTIESIKDDIDEKLRDVKICDPAIGSGAFPMGMLKELFLCRSAIEGTDQSKAAEIKRHIIQNNIYGVDIERGAVDIARLRFWLSLVVDEESPEALPNLDFKIMQGNSLMESYKGVDLSNLMKLKKEKDDTIELTFFDDFTDNYRRELNNLMRQYYDCNNANEKKRLRKQIKDNVMAQVKERHYDVDLLNVDIAGNSDFFLWHTWFSDVFSKGGFDIVIANPPYINVELMTDDEKKIYKQKYRTFYKRSDIFALFYELALMILSSEAGKIVYIIPSVVHSNLSYEKLRNLIFENSWLKGVCYTGGDVFNEPTVDTTILFCDKSGNENIQLTNATSFNRKVSHSVKENYFSKFNNVISIGEEQSDKIFSKLFAEGLEPVSDNFTVFQGIVTGNNDAFVFETEEEALSYGIDSELLHPMCHGRDVGKYVIRNRDRRMLYLNSEMNIDKYPSTDKWLENFKEVLSKRREAVKGTINWYSLQWPRHKSELDIKNKILIQNTRNESLKTRIVAALDNTGIYGTQGLNFIIPKTDKVSLYYLLGILNSKAINYLFATKFLNLAIKADYVKQVLIPTKSNALANELEKNVRNIIASKEENPESDIENCLSEIDGIVYQLYGLTSDEIAIIEA
jgi:type I restriction-modification system DNA methylase subunit